MEIDGPIPVHETAFMISSFRSLNPILSKDPYAYLWNNEATDKWVKPYLEQVSIDEKWSHCLRNRYFLDQISELISHNKIEALINFGAGFSMYPYLIESDILHIEIDKPEVIDFKTQMINKWQEEGKLPHRKIHSISVDFSMDYEESLREKIVQLLDGKKCFILVEGVLFFLTREITEDLFNFFNNLQQPGDYIGSVSFLDSLKDTQAFKNLLQFFDKRFTEDENPYHTVEDEFYLELPNYKLLDKQDYFSLSKQHKHTPELDRDNILNETFYILRKY